MARFIPLNKLLVEQELGFVRFSSLGLPHFALEERLLLARYIGAGAECALFSFAFGLEVRVRRL